VRPLCHSPLKSNRGLQSSTVTKQIIRRSTRLKSHEFLMFFTRDSNAYAPNLVSGSPQIADVRKGSMKTVVIGLLCVIAAVAAEETPTLSREQAKVLARSANTPARHLMLAEYYRRESRHLIAESREYAAKADEYDRNPGSHPVPKYPTYGMHCRSLSTQYLKDANKAAALATAQDRLAE